MANIYTDRVLNSKLAKFFITTAVAIGTSRADLVAVGVGIAKHTDHHWHLCILFVIAYNVAIAALFSTGYLLETKKSNLNFKLAIASIEALKRNDANNKDLRSSIEKGDLVIDEFDEHHQQTMKTAKKYGLKELFICSILGFVSWLPNKDTTYGMLAMGFCFYQFVGWAKQLRLTIHMFAQAASIESLVSDLRKAKETATSILGNAPTEDTQAQSPSEASPA